MGKWLAGIAGTVISAVLIWWITKTPSPPVGHYSPRPPPRARMSATEDGYDRHGSDYKDFFATDIDQCLSECAADVRCKAISFNKSSRQCWMKNAYAERRQNSTFISAVKIGD